MPDGGVFTVPAILSLIGLGVSAVGTGVNIAGGITQANQQRARNGIQNAAEIEAYKLQQKQFEAQKKQLAESRTNLAQDVAETKTDIQADVATKAATSGFLNAGTFNRAEDASVYQVDKQYTRQLSQLAYQEQGIAAAQEQARIAREANQNLYNQGLQMNATDTFFNAAAAGLNGAGDILGQLATATTNNWWQTPTT